MLSDIETKSEDFILRAHDVDAMHDIVLTSMQRRIGVSSTSCACWVNHDKIQCNPSKDQLCDA